MSKKTKIVTGEVRLSYAHLLEAKTIGDGQKAKFSTSILIKKDDKKTVDAINAAIDAAIEEGIAKFGGKKPNKAAIKLPLRDGDVERDDDASYKGCYFLNCSSTTKPQIVNKDLEPILDPSEIYSGCYVRVSINFYAYNVNGSKGVAVGLGNVQKLRDGEPLGGKSTAEDDFGKTNEEFL